MPEHRILVIEDDAAIREGLVEALKSEGYGVTAAPDGWNGCWDLHYKNKDRSSLEKNSKKTKKLQEQGSEADL